MGPKYLHYSAVFRWRVSTNYLPYVDAKNMLYTITSYTATAVCLCLSLSLSLFTIIIKSNQYSVATTISLTFNYTFLQLLGILIPPYDREERRPRFRRGKTLLLQKKRNPYFLRKRNNSALTTKPTTAPASNHFHSLSFLSL